MGTRWPPRIGGHGGGGGGAVILGGDATGPSGANTVVGIQGNPVSPAAPGLGEALIWDGVAWVPSPIPGGATIAATYLTTGVILLGDLVYKTGVVDEVARADNAGLITGPCFGVVVSIPGPGTAVVLFAGEASVFAGLTPGATYWVGSAGALTTTPPTPPGTPGEYVQEMGVAKNATTLAVGIRVPTIL